MSPTVSAAGQRSPPSVVRFARELGRDPFVQLQLAMSAAVVLLYLLPIVSPEQLASFSETWFCVTFMVWPVAGCLANLPDVPAAERDAWRTMGAGLACWLTALLVVALWPADAWSPLENAIVAALYMAYYLFAILAMRAMPLDGVVRDDSRLERRLGRLGLIIFVSGWVLYIVILPGILEQQFSGEIVVDSPMSIVLGSAVITQAALRWRRSASPRSRSIAGAIALAALALLVADSLTLLSYVEVIDLTDGMWTDAFWAIPGIAMVLAVRLRHCTFPAVRALQRTAPDQRERTPITLGIYLMVGGLSFLLVDAVIRLAGFVSTDGRTATTLVELTLIIASLSLVTLAAISHWLLNERSAAMRFERRQLQARLDESSKMEALGRLAGGVAHDFNNLLAIVAGTSDLMLEDLPEDSPMRPLVRMNREAVDRAAALTRQLLIFSRRQITELAVIDAGAVISRMTAMLDRIIGGTIRIEVSEEPPVPLAKINPAQFEQVVLNLVMNARDAMPDGGTICISTRGLNVQHEYAVHSGVLTPGTYVVVSVRDAGPGISDDVRPHIFEPFFTTKAADGSRGVGLATSYGIVTQNGGAFTVESESGSGATLTFYLPASLEPAEAVAPAAVAVPLGGYETILLAEDSDEVRFMTRRLLESRHYTVVEAASPSAAMTLCREHSGPIHLLLTDVIMPELNGPELSRKVIALRPEICVLFMSGHAGESAVKESGVLGASNFIAKPFSLDDLTAKVRSVLDGRATPPA